MKIGLILLFFITALIYSSVGFGGGSTYTALLVLLETDYRSIPIIALSCNIIVVAGNTLRYQREGFLNISKFWPLFVLSVPAAWLGGSLNVSEVIFIGLLWMALLLTGLQLLLSKTLQNATFNDSNFRPMEAALIGGFIGFYSGLVGIGGGIFLAPILYWKRCASIQSIAAVCSFFILVNSVSGLFGQSLKLQSNGVLIETLYYWPLLLSVMIGGFIGNHIGVFKLNITMIKKITAVLILVVSLRLAIRWIGML